MSDQIQELVWHADGHFLEFQLNKEEIRVFASICPAGESKDSECFHEGVSGCIVKHFINVYGLDCNVGQADITPRLEIAWSASGSSYDPDLVNFYMIPLADPAFNDWYTSQTSNLE